jgi:hypothetical protein
MSCANFWYIEEFFKKIDKVLFEISEVGVKIVLPKIKIKLARQLRL